MYYVSVNGYCSYILVHSYAGGLESTLLVDYEYSTSTRLV